MGFWDPGLLPLSLPNSSTCGSGSWEVPCKWSSPCTPIWSHLQCTQTPGERTQAAARWWWLWPQRDREDEAGEMETRSSNNFGLQIRNNGDPLYLNLDFSLSRGDWFSVLWGRGQFNQFKKHALSSLTLGTLLIKAYFLPHKSLWCVYAWWQGPNPMLPGYISTLVPVFTSHFR